MDGENLPELNEQLELAEKVLTLAVLVILITAPIGAVAIMASGQCRGKYFFRINPNPLDQGEWLAGCTNEKQG